MLLLAAGGDECGDLRLFNVQRIKGDPECSALYFTCLLPKAQRLS